MNRLVRKTGRRPNLVALNPEPFLGSVTSALKITGLPVKKKHVIEENLL